MIVLTSVEDSAHCGTVGGAVTRFGSWSVGELRKCVQEHVRMRAFVLSMQAYVHSLSLSVLATAAVHAERLLYPVSTDTVSQIKPK